MELGGVIYNRQHRKEAIKTEEWQLKDDKRESCCSLCNGGFVNSIYTCVCMCMCMVDVINVSLKLLNLNRATTWMD